MTEDNAGRGVGEAGTVKLSASLCNQLIHPTSLHVYQQSSKDLNEP